MKAGNLVRVVHHDPQGPYPETPVWDAVGVNFRGRVRHGDVFVVVRTNLRKCGLGVASAGWSGDAEISTPDGYEKEDIK